MFNLNNVQLAGNLTRDPELRNAGGKSVCAFSLAINRQWKDKSGEKKEDVTFVECEAWERTGELVSQYLSKGSSCFVEGRLKMDTWEDKDGGKRSKLKVVAMNVQFTGTPKAKEDAPLPMKNRSAAPTLAADEDYDPPPF